MIGINGKRGATLIEAVIAIAVVSIAVVTLLEALNIGMTGTLDVNRKVSALNIAKSQLESVKGQDYNASTGNLASTYKLITANGGNISDKINYNISGQVSRVSTNPLLEKITVNVSYLNGKNVQLTGFKTAAASTASPASPPSKGKIVTDVVEDMPYLQPGGWALGCLFGDSEDNHCGSYTGYYHVFTTTQSGYMSATWRFNWTNEVYPAPNAIFAWGAPYIGIYSGTPAWVKYDYQGNLEPDGVIFRPGCSTGGGNGGCMPDSDSSTCGCPDMINDSAPIVMRPDSCNINVWNMNWVYELYGDVYGESEWWAYPGGYYEFSVTTPDHQDPGTYTVLFFNGEDRLSYQTISASVTYVH